MTCQVNVLVKNFQLKVCIIQNPANRKYYGAELIFILFLTSEWFFFAQSGIIVLDLANNITDCLTAGKKFISTN